MHRVSPFRKGIVRFTTAPVVSPQPKPPMRGTNLPCPVAPCSGLLLVPRHGWNLRCGRAVLQAPLGCASHTWCGVVFLGCLRQRPWGRFRRASLPGGRSGRFQRASLSPADWVRRRAPEGGWGRSRAQGGSRIMHSSTIDAPVLSLAVLRVPYMGGFIRSSQHDGVFVLIGGFDGWDGVEGWESGAAGGGCGGAWSGGCSVAGGGFGGGGRGAVWGF
jgi:hypothetical protein